MQGRERPDAGRGAGWHCHRGRAARNHLFRCQMQCDFNPARAEASHSASIVAGLPSPWACL